MTRVPADLLMLGRHPGGELERLADEGESAGYRRLWIADERFFPDCWVVLGALASRPGGVGLGVCVTDPFIRHPALTATAAATVDELSGGSFTLGLGAGISGFEAMGIERRRPLVAMRETIHIVRELLAGNRVDLSGEVVTFRGRLDVPPRPHIPIMVATNGPQMLRLAGELADEVMVQGMATPTMVQRVREHIATGAERAGRDPQAIRLTARVDVCIADRAPETARAAMRPGLVRHLATHHPRYASFQLAGVEVPDELAQRAARLGYGHNGNDLAQAIPDEWTDYFCLAGSSLDVARRLPSLVEAGVDGITVMPVPIDGVTTADIIRSFAAITE